MATRSVQSSEQLPKKHFLKWTKYTVENSTAGQDI